MNKIETKEVCCHGGDITHCLRQKEQANKNAVNEKIARDREDWKGWNIYVPSGWLYPASIAVFRFFLPFLNILYFPVWAGCSIWCEPLWEHLLSFWYSIALSFLIATQTATQAWSPALPCLPYRLPLGLQSVLGTFLARLPAWVLSYGW